MGAVDNPHEVSIGELCIDELRTEAGALLRMHYEEVRGNQDTAPLDPDWGQYLKLEEAGVVFAFGARNRDGDLVGYAQAIYAPRHLHYDVSYVQVDIAFVHPMYRKGGTFKRLMVALKAEAVLRGATEMLSHAVPGSRMQQVLDGSKAHQLRDFNYTEVI